MLQWFVAAGNEYHSLFVCLSVSVSVSLSLFSLRGFLQRCLNNFNYSWYGIRGKGIGNGTRAIGLWSCFVIAMLARG